MDSEVFTCQPPTLPPCEGTAFRRFADSADSRSRKLAEELLSILVDLHPLVKGSLALGLPGYGLKNVEKMFKQLVVDCARICKAHASQMQRIRNIGCALWVGQR